MMRFVRTAAVVAVGAVVLGAPIGAAPAGAQTAPTTGAAVKVDIRVRRQYDLPSPLYVPVDVALTDAGTGRPVDGNYDVYVKPTNLAGEDVDAVGLDPSEAGSLPGRYNGIVILPHGGNWTLQATVARPNPSGKGAVTVAAASLDVSVVGGVLGSTKGVEDPLRGRLERSGGKYARSVVVLWLHTLLAIGWFACVAVLGLLAVPQGRRLLSTNGVGMLDCRLETLVRVTAWLTALIVATGVLNMRTELAYAAPLSAKQWHVVSKLPYARPYLLSFAAKLALFATMVALVVPVVRSARRLAAVDGAGRDLDLTEFDRRRPGATPARREPEPVRATVPAGPVADAAVGIALTHRPTLWDDDDPVVADRPAGSDGPRRALVAFFTAGPALLLAVTIMKYAHLLVEAYRAR